MAHPTRPPLQMLQTPHGLQRAEPRQSDDSKTRRVDGAGRGALSQSSRGNGRGRGSGGVPGYMRDTVTSRAKTDIGEEEFVNVVKAISAAATARAAATSATKPSPSSGNVASSGPKTAKPPLSPRLTSEAKAEVTPQKPAGLSAAAPARPSPSHAKAVATIAPVPSRLASEPTAKALSQTPGRSRRGSMELLPGLRVSNAPGGQYQQQVYEAMKKAVRESLEMQETGMVDPVIFPSALSSRRASVTSPTGKLPVFFAPAPSLTSSFIDPTILNGLFPTQDEPASRTLTLPDGTRIWIVPVAPTGSEITHLSLSQEQIEGVTKLRFLNSGLTNDQLEALTKFAQVEEISLCGNPDLTDESARSLCQWQGLRKLEIQFCRGFTSAGIPLLKDLPMENLEEVSFSVNGTIEASDTLRKLANAPKLRRLSFNLCEGLTPEALLCFKDLPADREFEISIKGCPEIDATTIEALNAGKTTPITIHIAAADVDEPPEAIEAEQLIAPPPFPESEDTFSSASIDTVFGKEGLPKPLGPDESDLRRISGVFASKNLSHIRALALEGIQDDELIALVEGFTGTPIEKARIYNCPKLSRTGIISLRGLKDLTLLHIGECPEVPAKGLEQLFTQKGTDPLFPNLEDIYLAGMPVSNGALEKISKLPKLARVDLSFCPDITWQGIRHLIPKQTLKFLRLTGCPRIDPFALEEFRKRRPEVQIEASDYVSDPVTNQIAITEAAFLPRRYIWILNHLTDHGNPLPESHTFNQADISSISEFYTNELTKYGITFQELGIEEMARQHWLKADLVIQSLKNIIRTRDAFISMFIELGYFTDRERKKGKKVPFTIGELMHFLEDPPSPVRQVREFNFSGLGLTHIPSFISQRDWPRFEKIISHGNPYLAIPEKFTAKSDSQKELETIGLGSGRATVPPPRSAATRIPLPTFNDA